jgi:hypothetical protein
LSHELGLTGDLIRLLVKQTIETAKEIYTNTGISKNPVSVVSLAYRQLRQLNIKNDEREFPYTVKVLVDKEINNYALELTNEELESN